MNIKMYDDDVRAFVQKNNGVFIVLSHDQHFNKNLRGTLQRHLHIKEECVFNIFSREKINKTFRQTVGNGHNVIFFVEREINGKYSHDLVQSVKYEYPGVHIMILTEQVPKDVLIYLHEVGASNVITKPISADMLIQKIAVTAKNFGQIGKLIEAGNKFNDSGRFAESAAIANRLLKIKPSNPAALILLGDSHKGLGRTEDALNFYHQASQGAELYLDPIKRIANLHNEAGNMREETRYLEKLDKLSPLNVERKVRLGSNYVSLGKRDKAEAMFEGAVKIVVKEGAAQCQRVAQLIAERCLATAPDIAEKYLRQALDAKKNILDRSDIETINRLGITLRKQGKWDQAVLEYRKALKISPNDSGLYYNIAMAFSEGGRFQDASLQLDKALELNPELWSTSETVCYNIATVYSRSGRQEMAVFFLQKVLSLNPESERARAMLHELLKVPSLGKPNPTPRPATSREIVIGI